jgi:diacylglycerol kinase (ATP)
VYYILFLSFLCYIPGMVEGVRNERTAAVVFNPRAGRAKKMDLIEKMHLIECVAENLEDKGWQVEPYPSESGEHITEIARNEKAKKTTALFVIGGDGSYNFAAQGLLSGEEKSDTALAPLPDGTIRMLRRGFKIPANLLHAVKLLGDEETSQIRSMDAGVMNGRYFLTVAGIGYDGHVLNNVQRSGVKGYLETTLREVSRHEGSPAKITVDGDEFDTRLHTAFIGNTGKLAYLPLRREAKCDDGKLEGTFLKGNLPRGNGWAVGGALAAGLLFRREIPFLSHYTQGESFTILSSKPFYSQIDGELMPQTDEWRIHVVPNALNVLVPNREIEIFSRK